VERSISFCSSLPSGRLFDTAYKKKTRQPFLHFCLCRRKVNNIHHYLCSILNTSTFSQSYVSVVMIILDLCTCYFFINTRRIPCRWFCLLSSSLFFRVNTFFLRSCLRQKKNVFSLETGTNPRVKRWIAVILSLSSTTKHLLYSAFDNDLDDVAGPQPCMEGNMEEGV